jgi:hypothetical protein
MLEIDELSKSLTQRVRDVIGRNIQAYFGLDSTKNECGTKNAGMPRANVERLAKG